MEIKLLTPDTLTCDESHVYRLGSKRRLMGVTEILRSAGICPASDYTNDMIEHSKKLGEYVHLACAMDDRGELDEDTLDDAIRPYLTAWRAWKLARPDLTSWIEIETPIHDETWAGTPDRISEYGTSRSIIEIKTGEPKKWHRIQAQAYAVLSGYGSDAWRVLVYLNADGTYDEEHWAPDETHLAVWQSAVTIAHWKRERESH